MLNNQLEFKPKNLETVSYLARRILYLIDIIFLEYFPRNYIKISKIQQNEEFFWNLHLFVKAD